MSYYPHQLNYTVKTVLSPTTQNGQGHFVKPINGVESEPKTYDCRYEPEGEVKRLPSNNGEDTYFSGMIYSDVDCPELDLGEYIFVMRNGQMIAEGDVKRFSRGTFNVRIWL